MQKYLDKTDMAKKTLEPDHKFWLQNSQWNLLEATYLLLNIEPRVHDEEYREHYNVPEPPPGIGVKLREYKQLLERGPFVLFPNESPAKILEWCLETKIPIPEKLAQTAIELEIFEKEGKKDMKIQQFLNNRNKPKWEKWLLLDRWELDAAITLSVGLDPDREQRSLTKSDFKLIEKMKERAEIAHASIKVGKLKAQIGMKMTDYFDQIEEVHVDPKVFVEWLISKNQELPPELEKWYYENHKKVPTPTPPIIIEAEGRTVTDEKNGYKLRHQKNRDTILGAALCAVVNFPDRCKASNGRFSGAKITDVIEQEDELATFVQNEKGEFIMEKEGMLNLINSCLKLETISKSKIEETYKKMK